MRMRTGEGGGRWEIEMERFIVEENNVDRRQLTDTSSLQDCSHVHVPLASGLMDQRLSYITISVVSTGLHRQPPRPPTLSRMNAPPAVLLTTAAQPRME
jgi:hypothetical protein